MREQDVEVTRTEDGEPFVVQQVQRTERVDRRDGGKRLDVALSGPVVGLTWRF